MKRLFLALLGLLAVCGVAQAATCNVTEFRLVIVGNAQVAQLPPIVDQAPITVTGSSAQSATLNGETGLVRLWCDTQSAAVVGPNATATTNNMPLSATAAEYFAVAPGPNNRAAFILRP